MAIKPLYTAEDYYRQLQRLLPTGSALPRDDDADFSKLLRSLAEEFARVDQRLADLFPEADPATVVELLDELEAAANLPNPNLPPPVDDDERRLNLDARFSGTDGDDGIPYFIDLAARLGSVITITEFRPFRVSFSRVGDPLSSEAGRYTWQVNAPVYNADLEAEFNRLAPPWTTVTFNYGV